MAGDVAQFLRNKFLASLRVTESELSGVVLISDLGAIKDIVIDIDTRRLTKDYYRCFISVLLELTDALTKCQVFSNEWKKHSHHKTHLTVFNHLSLRKICFVLKMKKRLAVIKRKFEDDFVKKKERIYILSDSSSRPDAEENLESELPVLIHPRQRFETVVVGFDEQLQKIDDFLLESSPSSGAGFAAVGIVGMAGAGKTTLVREFLSSWIVRCKFSPIIWLCLSNIIKENKQVEEEIEVSIVKCMLSKLDHNAVAEGDGIIQEEEKAISSNNSGHLLAALLERLNQHLSGKSYLIVLDDVWHMNDFYSDLGQLLEVQEGDKKVGDRLSHGLPKGSGGAVIVTSRIPEVVEAMVVPAEVSDKHYKSLIISLGPLDRESCWNIFKDSAFGYQQHLEKVQSEINEIKDLCYGGLLPDRISEDLPDLSVEPDSFHIKKSPVLVFIDEHAGEELFGKFCDLLTKKQGPKRFVVTHRWM
ncbi:P-loop containing nucleoside triphosphate hydrolases superfamily protein [Prunus dulcis]|uniref:P-loop containing nucleoside triphosphate hydrolases superfamily protein n=1 Tax=Prunus dulcis TaxID=3755 RepID=A0A4Y1RWW5_PRUDU|nr:P-loop containing nucleoside triphosphate hydrolases superfamily protein [Prunus dulcis]